jgi:hypothetical protein
VSEICRGLNLMLEYIYMLLCKILFHECTVFILVYKKTTFEELYRILESNVYSLSGFVLDVYEHLLQPPYNVTAFTNLKA